MMHPTDLRSGICLQPERNSHSRYCLTCWEIGLRVGLQLLSGHYPLRRYREQADCSAAVKPMQGPHAQCALPARVAVAGSATGPAV
ncbi:hypothetical protein M407DRAFT_118233 [Tulasnella calospora MUT 4182]|uniref:Uncharacterized protein n=1 Tax=Tulasnella calospora MUT 4182 TaxID=1051891 RepID=A0A0C3QIN1_9AGAM|nr:hypothetical protein M407DRAFT_118233 [Tulasnella calospora MUT 4182]